MSSDPCSKQSGLCTLQSGCTSSKEPTMTITREHRQAEVPAPLTSFEEAELCMLEKSLFLSNSVEIEGKQGSGRPSDECLSEEVIQFLQSDFSHEAVSDVQLCQNLIAQVGLNPIISTTKDLHSLNFSKDMSNYSRSFCDRESEDAENASRQQHEFSCTQLLPGSMHTGACEKYDESSGATSNGYFQNKMSCDFKEVSQPQHGTHRRCLQFEFPGDAIDKSHCSQTAADTFPSSRSLVDPTYMEISGPSHMESRVTPSSRQPANLSGPTTFRLSLLPTNMPEKSLDKANRSVRISGNSTMVSPVRSGIGLHLNSIVNVVDRGRGAAAGMEIEKHPLAQGEESQSVIKRHLLNDSKSCSLTVTLSGKLLTDNNDDLQENSSIVKANSTTFQSSGIKPLNDTMQLKLIEHQISPCNKRKSASENAESSEELNQPNPKRKRKDVSYTIGGCKRCSCKKSKCLKLYCECFAAGLYCAEPCGCEDCFNKREYEDIVLGVRKKIESRNPHAFTPKLVRRITKSPLNNGEDSKQVIPSPVRHKRGCSCKKSECMKRYCECYQAGVGCSDGCRCEGCKNVFGVKEGCYEAAEPVNTSSSNERWEDPSDVKLGIVGDRGNFLPPEQHHTDNVSPSTPSFKSYSHRKDLPKCQLPASSCIRSSGINILSSTVNSSRSQSESNYYIAEPSKGILYHNKLECASLGIIDQFLPKQDGVAGYNMTHSPSPSVLSNNKGSSCPSGLPITPFRRLGESKFSYMRDALACLDDILDNDTPEILKDQPIPINVVKTSSPNQKRISPPHIHDQKPSSLTGGRKFILQSISSFPPQPP